APDWQDVSNMDPNGQRRLVIVFQGHSDQGELKVRKAALGNSSFDDFIKSDEAASLRYQPGFVKVKREEAFGGGPLTGKLIEFDFKRYNNPREGRYYYLDDKKGNVWILMFSGVPTVMRNVRPDTDKMARSFKPLG
ncbi:MAG TPA: hypothetical protein VFC63_10815, partial [Blastocatellia bacterium]|nr:hypothetical protein [Blastocatellia bacterium]